MVVTVAHECAIAMPHAGTHVLDATASRGRDIGDIEIDEMRGLLNAMGIVAGRAGRLIGDHVTVVELETLVGEDAVPAVAFVAQVVRHRAFDLEIHCVQIPFKDGSIDGTVRTIGAHAAGVGTLVAVMTIGA